jgi:nucleotide-binding universal stress UspA family protein
MLPPRTILVGFDFSACSELALTEAHAIASAHGARLRVCHSVASALHVNALFPEDNWRDALAVPKLMEAAGDLAERRVAELLGRASDSATLTLDHGPADSAILRQAEEQGADLIVVGGHAHAGRRHVVLGSVAERVARYAHCSVLVVRPGPGSGQVLAASDFSDSARQVVGAAGREAKRRGGRLTILHSLGLGVPPGVRATVPLGATIQLPPQDAIDAARALALEMLANGLSELGLDGHRIVPAGVPEDDIIEAAAKLGAELVVVGSRGRTALARVALGSVAETVVHRASCSVLVVRGSKRA